MFGEIVVKVSADLESLNKGIASAGKTVEAFGKKVAALGKKMSVISGAIAGVGGAAVALASSAAAAGNAIDKTAKAVGLSTTAYQELGFAIGQVSDLTQDQFDAALRQMNTRLGQAASGSENMVKVFEQVGFSAEELASGAISSEEAFQALTQRLTEMTDPAQAAALAGQLLGEEAAKLGPLLMQSGGDIDGLRDKAHALGIVMGEDGVAAAASYTDKMDEVTRQMGAMRDQVGVALMPIIIKLADVMQQTVIPAIGGIVDKVGQAIEWFSGLPGPVQEAAGVLALVLGVGGPVLLAVGAMAAGFAGLMAAAGPVGLFIAGATVAVAAWQMFGDDIIRIVGGAIEAVSDAFNGVVEFLQGLPDRMMQIGTDIMQGLLNGILERIEAIKETFTGFTNFMPDTMRNLLGIESPSKVFAEIGRWIGIGLAEGIEGTQADVTRAVEVLGNEAEARAAETAKSVVDGMGQLFAGSKPLAAAQALINAYLGATEALKLPFPASLGAFASVLSTGLGAVNAIKGTSKSGSSGGGAAPAAPSVTNNFAPNISVTATGTNATPDAIASAVTDQLSGALQQLIQRGGVFT